MYYINLKCGESYDFHGCKNIGLKDGILSIKLQYSKGGWFKDVKMWLRTIKETNVSKINDMIKIQKEEIKCQKL